MRATGQPEEDYLLRKETYSFTWKTINLLYFKTGTSGEFGIMTNGTSQL